MLKDIGKFHKVAWVIKREKKISSFFYNHNRLHAKMRDKIGGELIRRNATRFGTVLFSSKVYMIRKTSFGNDGVRWVGK